MKRSSFRFVSVLISILLFSGCTANIIIEEDVPTSSQESSSIAQSISVPDIEEQEEEIEESVDETTYDYSVFSWHDNVFNDDRDELIATMKENNIQTIYQWFSSDVEDEVISEFTEVMQQEDLGVYVLTGDPSFAKSKYLDSVYKVIDRAVEIGNVSGVVIDIEPGQLDEFDEDPEPVMEEFAHNLNLMYEYAKESGFEVVICISANWEEFSELEEMIRDSCDAVCVMNYFVDSEYKTIKDEAEFALEYGKELINATEIQPVGDHGVTEKNTYYGEDIDTVFGMWQELADRLYDKIGTEDISFSIHEVDSLMAMNE